MKCQNEFFMLSDVIFLVRLQGKFEVDHSWEKTSYQNCIEFVILCNNRWLETEMDRTRLFPASFFSNAKISSARSPSPFPFGRAFLRSRPG